VSALGIEEQRVNVVLDFTDPLDRVPTLGDGYRVDAQIVTARIEDAVKVPVGALFRDGEGWAVFVIENGRAAKRAIKAPRRNALEALVEQGLVPGERVVVYPPDGLKDGSRVALVTR
jgi:HlyD family secretion protein